LDEKYNNLRNICWKKAVDCYGTASIFEKRVRKLKHKIRLLRFIGILVPLLVGGVVISFGSDYKHLEIIIYFAGFIGLLQLGLNLWSLVDRWDDNYAYYLKSMAINNDLSRDYESIAHEPPSDFKDFKWKHETLDAKDRIISETDNHHNIGEREKRYGMRVALRQFKRPCGGCGKVPQSLKPTKCPVCGNF